MRAVRFNIQMFATQQVAPPGIGNSALICNHDDGGNNGSNPPVPLECSMIVPCDQLVRKTVQLACAANALATGVIIQGSFFASGDRNPEWVDLTGTIVAPGIFVIGLETSAVGAAQSVLEPELNFIRIRSTFSMQGLAQPLPRSLKAILGGVYHGDGPYEMRVGQFGK